jgi:hypothetical protein
MSRKKGFWIIIFVVSIIASILGFWFVEVVVDIDPLKLMGMFLFGGPGLAGLVCCILLVRWIRKCFRNKNEKEKE